MQSYDQIQAQIAALQEQAKAAKAERELEAREAAKLIRPEYVYTVEWTSEYVFKCSRQMTQASRDARKAWKEKYAGVQSPWYSGDDELIGSMRYILVTNVMKSFGGGYCVLKESRKKGDFFPDEPMILTDDEVEQLRHFKTVPASLKNEVD